MSGLELNKFAAAILVAGLIAMIAGKATNLLYHPVEQPAERGYQVAVTLSDEAVGTEEEAAPENILYYLHGGDAAAGEALTRKCTTCHTFEKGGAHKVGPNLWNIVNSDIAAKKGYAYSDALAALQGTWTYQDLSVFLTKPKDYAPGTKMAYIGMKKPEDRADLLAYLRTLSDSPAEIPPAPEPEPVEDPAAASESLEPGDEAEVEEQPEVKIEEGELPGSKEAEKVIPETE